MQNTVSWERFDPAVILSGPTTSNDIIFHLDGKQISLRDMVKKIDDKDRIIKELENKIDTILKKLCTVSYLSF